MILARPQESLGELLGTLARLDDNDLDREPENYFPKRVLERQKRRFKFYRSSVEKARAD